MQFYHGYGTVQTKYRYDDGRTCDKQYRAMQCCIISILYSLKQDAQPSPARVVKCNVISELYKNSFVWFIQRFIY